jgi:DNA polymerase III sliding clamp (beta) subunit (PCNA family)
MKIPKQCKIEKAASKDATREILNHICIDTQDGKTNAVATDGRMMAIVPVELCEDDDAATQRLLPIKALTEARKQARQAKESTIGLNGAVKMLDGTTFAAPNLGDLNFPNYRQVIPKRDKAECVTVRFNTKALYELAQAIGAVGDVVTLQIAKDGEPLVIEEDTTGAKGVLMPVRAE